MAPSIASHAQSISFKAEDRKITRPFPPPLPPALTPCLPSPWCSALASARTPHAVPPGAANAPPRSPPGLPAPRGSSPAPPARQRLEVKGAAAGHGQDGCLVTGSGYRWGGRGGLRHTAQQHALATLYALRRDDG